MGNLLIATHAALRAATIRSGPTAPSLPVANLKRLSPAEVVRLVDLTQAWIEIEFAAAMRLDVVALLNVRCSVEATMRLRAADTAADCLVAPTWDSGVAPIRTATPLEHRKGTVHAPRFPPAPMVRVVRIDIDDPAATGGYVDIGALVVGAGFQPANGIPYGWQIGVMDPGRKPQSADGQTKPLPKSPYMAGRFVVDWLSEDEALGTVFDIQAGCGTTRPALVVRDSTAVGDRLERQTIYGLFEDVVPISHAEVDQFETIFEIREETP